MPSHVQVMSKPYPNSLTYYLVNDNPCGVSDMHPTGVRVFMCPTHGHSTRLSYPCFRGEMSFPINALDISKQSLLEDEKPKFSVMTHTK